jgi:hypothetical protein
VWASQGVARWSSSLKDSHVRTSIECINTALGFAIAFALRTQL